MSGVLVQRATASCRGQLTRDRLLQSRVLTIYGAVSLSRHAFVLRSTARSGAHGVAMSPRCVQSIHERRPHPVKHVHTMFLPPAPGPPSAPYRERQVVKYVCTAPPRVGVPILALALVVEAVHLRACRGQCFRCRATMHHAAVPLSRARAGRGRACVRGSSGLLVP